MGPFPSGFTLRRPGRRTVGSGRVRAVSYQVSATCTRHRGRHWCHLLVPEASWSLGPTSLRRKRHLETDLRRGFVVERKDEAVPPEVLDANVAKVKRHGHQHSLARIRDRARPDLKTAAHLSEVLALRSEKIRSELVRHRELGSVDFDEIGRASCRERV